MSFWNGILIIPYIYLICNFWHEIALIHFLRSVPLVILPPTCSGNGTPYSFANNRNRMVCQFPSTDSFLFFLSSCLYEPYRYRWTSEFRLIRIIPIITAPVRAARSFTNKGINIYETLETTQKRILWFVSLSFKKVFEDSRNSRI